MNNEGFNKYKYKLEEKDVDELLELLPQCEISTRIYVVTTKDGKDVNVENRFFNTVSEKLGIKDVFTEGVK